MASSPAMSESYGLPWAPSPSPTTAQKHVHKIYPDFSPPLIAMVAVIGTAFLIVLYARVLSRHVRRLWRRCRRLISTSSSAGDGDLESPPPNSNSNGFSFDPSTDYFFSPYGLDDSTIRSLPISLFSSLIKSSLNTRDCAVCLLEFEHGDSLRTLPLCSHAFHVDCIDVWLRSHATCPLCRAGVFVPMRASRIRPSFDDIIFDPAPETDIQPAATSPPASRSMLLKRSYSFGFERNLAADRLVLEASTASPWRYRPRGSIWSKRWPSPFAGPSSASRGVRVFSFGSHRGFAVRSPFVKWRGFYPLSESGGVRSHGGSGPSARRSMAMTSPSAMFMRSMATAGFSSSRMRCGDPEALLSPERLDHRR